MKQNSPTAYKLLWTGMTGLVLLAIVGLSTGASKPAKPEAKEAPKAAAKAEVKAPATTAPAKTEAKVDAPKADDTTSYLEAYGWMVGQQAGFEMGFSKEEVAAIIRGLERASEGKGAPENMRDIFPKMQQYLGEKEKAYRAKVEAKMEEEAKVHSAEGDKFIAEIAKQEGVKKTESGLYYKIEAVGTGATPTKDDVATIHYTGKLINGTVFDSSVERGEAVDLPLSGVIPGFSEGIQLLKEGGKATLYIPAAIAYGNRAAGPIPAGSTLIFTVELIKVHAKTEAPEATAAAEPVENTEIKAEVKAVAPKAEVKAEVKPAKVEKAAKK